MNSHLEGNNVSSEEQARDLVDRVDFGDTTPLAGSLRNKILGPLVYSRNLNKPLLVIIITDGQPTDNASGDFQRHIKEVKTHFGGRGMVAFQIAQVGNDPDAQAFLASLDTDPTIGGLIDCTSNFELEGKEFKQDPQSGGNSLTRELWYTKLLLGSIDKTYDKKDEGRSTHSGQPGYTAPASVSPNLGNVPPQGFSSQVYSHQQNSQYGQPQATQNMQTIHSFPPGGGQPGYSQGQQQQGYSQYTHAPYVPNNQGLQNYPSGGTSQGYPQGQVQQSHGQYGQRPYTPNQGTNIYGSPSGGTSPSNSPQPPLQAGTLQPQQGYNMPAQHLQLPGSATPNYSNQQYSQQPSQAPQGYQTYQPPQSPSPSGSYTGQPPPAQYTPNPAYAPQQR